MVSLRPLASCVPKRPLRPTPSITPKNSKHIIEFEKPKTDDCHPSKTLLQLNALFISQESLSSGLSANDILSIIWIKDAAAPMTEPIVNINQGNFILFLAISLLYY
jgi:hypothetical protein